MLRPTIRLALVDDATVVRELFSAMLPGFEVVSTHSRVEDLLLMRPQADVVLLDLHLTNIQQPDAIQGISAIRAVVDARYQVCVYTQEERRFVLAACLAAGAMGVVSKSTSAIGTAAALEAVVSGELVIPPHVSGLIEVLVRRGQISVLSPRQRDVLAGRARGLTYAEMSRSLYLSESTLRGYWREVTMTVSQYMQETSPGDIEQAMGLTPGDLLDCWPEG